MKIALIMGGDSSEREVSLMSAGEMQKALDAQKYKIIPIEIKPDDSREWVRRLMEVDPDLALLALHGGCGEDGAVQGLLTCLHIPYVGSKVLGSALCMDKNMSKFILRARHIPVAEDVFIPYSASWPDYTEKIRRMGLPLVVKPNRGGSSVGVSIVRAWESLEEALREASACQDDILIEQFIDGKEITCAVMETPDGPKVLPVLDIVAEDFYDYDAKYFSEQTKITFTALPPLMRDMASEIAKQSFTALCCGGYARVDMIVREEQIYVLEVNTLPGMTSHSLFPKAASMAGISYAGFLDQLIAFATNHSDTSL